MYTLMRLLPWRQLLARQLPSLGIALLIAERFYQFHSFTLECLAFLTTWSLIDGVFHWVVRWFDPHKE
jgi:hypothetical protein